MGRVWGWYQLTVKEVPSVEFGVEDSRPLEPRRDFLHLSPVRGEKSQEG